VLTQEEYAYEFQARDDFLFTGDLDAFAPHGFRVGHLAMMGKACIEVVRPDGSFEYAESFPVGAPGVAMLIERTEAWLVSPESALTRADTSDRAVNFALSTRRTVLAGLVYQYVLKRPVVFTFRYDPPYLWWMVEPNMSSSMRTLSGGTLSLDGQALTSLLEYLASIDKNPSVEWHRGAWVSTVGGSSARSRILPQAVARAALRDAKVLR